MITNVQPNTLITNGHTLCKQSACITIILLFFIDQNPLIFPHPITTMGKMSHYQFYDTQMLLFPNVIILSTLSWITYSCFSQDCNLFKHVDYLLLW